MSEPRTLPVLPLRNTIVFPGVGVPVAAARPGTLRALQRAMAADQRVFAVMQRDAEADAAPANLSTVGTIARVEQFQSGLAGAQMVLHGEVRSIAVRVTEHDGHLQAVVRELEEVPPLDPQNPAFLALHRELRERAVELGERVGLPRDVVRQVAAGVDDPGRFADLVASYVEVTPGERQELLATISVEERLRRVLVDVQRQLAVLSAQEDIQSKVREELGDRQREMFLREQLKAIQKELGESEGGEDLAELRARLDELELPQAARKEVDREFSRLARFGRESMEAQVIRTFLENVAELPWNARSEDALDLEQAATILDEDHHGLRDVKDRVLEFLSVRRLRSDRGVDAPTSSRAPILLFSGPPGVGKTSIARSIARAMGREYVRVSLGGARDQADISGHRRTYVGAMPGRIIAGMKQAGTKNPVFLLDEIDKLGVSFQGDPASALLEVLDPAQNDSFTDHYLGVPFDLSEVLFIATANYVDNIPRPLLDRMEVVPFAGYTEREKLGIAREYLLPRQLEDNGIDAAQLQVTEAAIATVISRYTREAGVRQLERELGKLARKVAWQIASKTARPPIVIDAADVRASLGRPRVHAEQASRRDQIGVATGMYYTPVGGDIMFVEATTMPGKGELVLTGQLGDVMRESARAAWSWARAHARALRIDGGQFQRDLHIHVPAGAIPKDGPSAGITIATAVVSILTGRPVRNDVAMTGEATLSGRVLPIGGVKEKVLGAVRAGITSIVLPNENVQDLEDLPDDVRAGLTVHGVDELGEVLGVALRGGRYEHGRLLFEGDGFEQVEPLSDADLDVAGAA